MKGKQITRVQDLQPDRRNANKGTQRGLTALDRSLRKYGAGRSILIDKHGQIIAGNKTAERAADIGLDDVIIVQTDGKKLVAVQRTDLDLEKDPEARALAVADNRVGKLDLEWEAEVLAEMRADIDLSPFWSEKELADLLLTEPVSVRSLDTKPPPKMTWVLIGIPVVRFGEINSLIEKIASRDGVICETSQNDGPSKED